MLSLRLLVNFTDMILHLISVCIDLYYLSDDLSSYHYWLLLTCGCEFMIKFLIVLLIYCFLFIASRSRQYSCVNR